MVVSAAPLRVGITGHRRLGDDPLAAWAVHARCVVLLDRCRALAGLRGAGVVAYSALAVGADQLFAQAALGLGLPLVGVLPYEGYAADFDGAERPAFEDLLRRCTSVE